MKVKDIIAGHKRRKHRNSRKHRITQVDLYDVDRTNLGEAKVGREYQHLEDLVFVHGSDGALKAADILDNFGQDSSDVAIKWDGNPTVYYGREPDGTFVLVGKNGWGRNKSTSSEDLRNFILSTGKGEDWREEFANGMAQMFEIVGKDFPQDFRGYVYGDLLYHPGKPFQAGENITFTPNKVTYTVNPDSEIGKRIAASKVGITLHTTYPEFGSKDSTPIENIQEFNSNDVFVIGQTYVTHTPNINISTTKEIRTLAKQHASSIDNFLAGQKGLSNPANIIYTYMNGMTKNQALDKIETGFFDWLKTSRVSPGQQAKLAAMNEQDPKALPAMFKLIRMIMTAKNEVIDQLDAASTDIVATTGKERGGEGYVAQKSKTKLVPRHRWTPNQ